MRRFSLHILSSDGQIQHSLKETPLLLSQSTQILSIVSVAYHKINIVWF